MTGASKDAWSAKARRLIPELRVLGALADASGWLVHIDMPPTAESLAELERKITLLGATGWHWEVDRGRIKMRIYTGGGQGQSRLALAALAALTAFILAWHYDILNPESTYWVGPY